jgi:hypothetical protein
MPKEYRLSRLGAVGRRDDEFVVERAARDPDAPTGQQLALAFGADGEYVETHLQLGVARQMMMMVGSSVNVRSNSPISV